MKKDSRVIITKNFNDEPVFTEKDLKTGDYFCFKDYPGVYLNLDSVAYVNLYSGRSHLKWQENHREIFFVDVEIIANKRHLG